MDTQPEWLQSLTFGFVHEVSKKQSLFMDIPTAIIWLIINFYPAILYKIGLHDEDCFEVFDDGLSIKSVGHGCSGYMVYADLDDAHANGIGLNKGIHFWSVQSNFEYECYFSIGITTVKSNEMVKIATDRFIGVDKTTKGYHYYHELYDHEIDEIVTVKLNCDEWKVLFYRNKELIKSDDIAQDQHYFLAMSLCNEQGNTSLQVVETPEKLLYSK